MQVDLTNYAITAINTAATVAIPILLAFIHGHVKNAAVTQNLATLAQDAAAYAARAGDAEVQSSALLHPDLNPLVATGLKFALNRAEAMLRGISTDDLASEIEAKLHLTKPFVAATATAAN